MISLSGRPFPLGSQLCEQQGQAGVNFAIFSRKATAINLCLFPTGEPSSEIRLPMQRSGDIWHLFVPSLAAGCQYGFRVFGETNVATGDLFNPQKLLLDPYAKQIVGSVDLSSEVACRHFLWHDAQDNAEQAPKSVVIDSKFSWENDRLLHTPWAETVIYEAHVKGFSQQNPAVPAPIAGTFAGMAHPASIAHLKRLGITAVELLPISHHLDEPHLQKMGLRNYWGYNVMGHFAVDPALAFDKQNPLNEFKQLVKTLHQANIEVILDVVFNHTAEAGEEGPLLSWRGIDNSAYYWLTPQGDYENWSGCGNALNINGEMSVLRWVIDCLTYWVQECHIDGFRFDLGALLGRSPTFSERAHFFAAIASNAVLADVKLIAEPWDIGTAGYQLGHFPPPFAEWNDRYRDSVRQFFLADPTACHTTSGQLGDFARRLAGSDDLFAHNRQPHHSINYLTAHDGFTLQDLVSYQTKHNYANGEGNRDGHEPNWSCNHGVEGETQNPMILAKRRAARQAMLATLLLSAGTPMLLAGDELGNSQQGNNNGYCQDNPITWLDWANADEALINYVAKLIALRKQIPILQRNQWWQARSVQWLTPQNQPMQPADWHDIQRRSLMVLLEERWLLIIHAAKPLSTAQTQDFLLPLGQWNALLGVETAMPMSHRLTLNAPAVCVFQRHNN